MVARASARRARAPEVGGTCGAGMATPGGANFHYRILQGRTLMLTPVLTKAMIQQALANPKKFSVAGWAVSVAYAGHSWRRVPCQGWC